MKHLGIVFQMGQCYITYVFLILITKFTHTYTRETDSSASWMTDMYDKIKDKTICDLLIPGTAFSTSYQIGINTKMSVNKNPFVDIAHFWGLSHEVSN